MTNPLQFDRAERATESGGATCAFCQQPISGSYYEINGKVTCLKCRGQILAAWDRGSPGVRFAKALGLGAAAAALGAGLYFGIEALTGYEFGLVAIVVGLIVGAAVRKGSTGRGGWRYQVLAMFLTYTAVVATDSTLIVREIRKQSQARADSVQVAGVAQPQAQAATGPRRDKPGPITLLVGLVVLVGIAYAAPIMIGVANPLHLVIAGFALYEAWKLNRGAALRVTGPYQATPRPASA